MDAIALQAALLLALLGHPNFDTRERATSTLRQQPVPILLMLAQSDDLEVRSRVVPIVKDHIWNSFAAEFDYRGWPYVDAIEGCPWLGLDLPTCGDRQPHECDWENYKQAARIWARWQLEAGKPQTDLRRILVQAEERSAYWRIHRQYPAP